jgi:hypothetical protein
MMTFDTEVGDQDAALVAVAQAGVAGSWIERGRILPQERLLATPALRACRLRRRAAARVRLGPVL